MASSHGDPAETLYKLQEEFAPQLISSQSTESLEQNFNNLIKIWPGKWTIAPGEPDKASVLTAHKRAGGVLWWRHWLVCWRTQLATVVTVVYLSASVKQGENRWSSRCLEFFFFFYRKNVLNSGKLLHCIHEDHTSRFLIGNMHVIVEDKHWLLSR